MKYIFLLLIISGCSEESFYADTCEAQDGITVQYYADGNLITECQTEEDRTCFGVCKISDNECPVVEC